jgi:TctA family transporter
VRLAGQAISRLSYQLFCLGVLVFLVAMTCVFTVIFGLFIFFLSTVVGIISQVAGINRKRVMGVLMLSLILRYI